MTRPRRAIYRRLAVAGVAVLGTISIYLAANRSASVSGRSVIWLVVAAGLACLFMRAAAITNKHTWRGSAVLGAVFAACATIGQVVVADWRLSPLWATPRATLATLLVWLGLAVVFTALLALLLERVPSVAALADRASGDDGATAATPPGAALADRASGDDGATAATPPGADDAATGNARPGRRTFWIAFGALAVCWLPYYVIFYPGVLSVDSVKQSKMALGIIPLTAHHPVVSTGLIALFERTGTALGSLTFGVGLYSAFQMLALAAALAAAVRYLADRGVPRWLWLTVLALFALLPTTAIYSVTMWKDVLFGALVVLFVVLAWDLVRWPREFLHRPSSMIAFVLVGFGFCVFRNNGLYSLVLCIPVFLIVLRRYWLRLTALFAAIGVLVVGYSALVSGPIGAKDTDVNLAMSVPLQQLARVLVTHGNDLTAAQREELETYLPIEEIPKVYQPWLSNRVKDRFDSAAFSQDPARFAQLWWELGVQHPGIYLDSFLDGNVGYWYPDANRWIVWNPDKAAVTRAGLDISEATGARAELQKTIVKGLDSASTWPLISVLLSIGFAMWVIAFAALVLIRGDRPRFLLAVLPVAGLWLSTLASPVFAEYRYLFGAALAAPVLLALAMTDSTGHTRPRSPSLEGKVPPPEVGPMVGS